MSDAGKNIVLVSIDSLRADHCGYLGDDHGLTPTLDALATTGVSFETAVATGPQTFSSMPAVFTGYRRPPETLEDYPGAAHWQRRLAAIEAHLDRYPSLPERLRERGYTTAGFSPNPWTTAASGFDRGFDHFEDFAGRGSDGRLRRLAERLPGIDADSKPVELTLDLLTGRSFFARWQDFYDDVDRLRRSLPEPYFLWIFLLDTHYPFLPTRAHRTEQSLPGMVMNAIRSERAMRGNAPSLTEPVRASMRRSYRDTVRSVDDFLGRLRADTAADDPALIVHSDHGESFGDHGNFGHHHRSVFEENVHVPYLVHNAGSARSCSDPVSLASVPDVTCSIADGRSLEPTSFTQSSVGTASECGTNLAVRGRRFKYMVREDDPALYDLETDPGERTDVSASHPERRAAFADRLERWRNHPRECTAVARAARRSVAETGLERSP